MSFNLCGFITNQKLSNQLDVLSSILHQEFVGQEVVTFEEALSDKEDNSGLDIYEYRDASFLLCDNHLLPEQSDLGILTNNKKYLVEFMLSDTSMVYAFRFYKQGQRFSQDFYAFEPSFACYGENKLNLSEEDDMIEVGLSSILRPLMGRDFSEINTSEQVLRINFEK